MTETSNGHPRPADEVGAMLARAGLPVQPYELAYLIAQYPYLKAGVDLLYTVQEARYADPALNFRADVPRTSWSG